MKCDIEGCDRPVFVKSRGWCRTHYHRWHRHGDPLIDTVRKPHIPKPCSIEGCDEPSMCRSWCNAHYQRWYKFGDPLTFKGPQRGAERYNWLGDDAGYMQAHDRVRRSRGKASEHPCQHCMKPAEQWAYDHADPDERSEIQVDRGGEPSTLTYSLDLEHYVPLCIPCHLRFDHSTNRTAS